MGASREIMRLIAAEDEEVRRRSVRHRVLLSAQIISTTDEQPARLRNLSVSGALVETAAPPKTGTDVILKRGSLEIFATVVWSEKTRCGLSFDEPLSEEELWAQLRPAPNNGMTAPPPQGYQPRRSGAGNQDGEPSGSWFRPVGRQAYLD